MGGLGCLGRAVSGQSVGQAPPDVQRWHQPVELSPMAAQALGRDWGFSWAAACQTVSHRLCVPAASAFWLVAQMPFSAFLLIVVLIPVVKKSRHVAFSGIHFRCSKQRAFLHSFQFVPIMCN